MKTRSDAAAWLAGALFWLACIAPALAFDLPELMATLGRQRAGEVRFTEQRQVSGLDAPLASSGILGFEPPDKLTRRVLQPRPESFAVDGNTLTLTRGGRSRSLALDSMPELLPLINLINFVINC